MRNIFDEEHFCEEHFCDEHLRNILMRNILMRNIWMRDMYLFVCILVFAWKNKLVTLSEKGEGAGICALINCMHKNKIKPFKTFDCCVLFSFSHVFSHGKTII